MCKKCDKYEVWLYGKLCSASYAVASSAKVLPLQTCLNVYRALYESNLMYCASTWAGTEAKYLKQILGHQTRVLKNLFNLPRASHISPALKKHKLLKTSDLLNREQIMVVHSMRKKLLPSPISGIFLFQIVYLDDSTRILFYLCTEYCCS